jgi:hypothetical protein
MSRQFNYVTRDTSPSRSIGLLLVLLSFLAAGSALAVSRHLPLGEFMLDTVIRGAPASNRQQAPAIAFDGANYLAVWQDYRGDGRHPDVYATRVSPQGRILDPEGIFVGATGASKQCPEVAFDGRNFLVSWVQSASIFAARVTSLGQVLDQTGLFVSYTGESLATPAVASDGNGSVVVWSDDRTTPDRRICAARITQDGAVLDTSGIPVGTTPGDNTNPAICYGGSSYLVVWDNQNYIPRVQDIRGVRLDAQGQLLDSMAIAIDTADGFQLRPSLAAGDSGWMVVWQGGWDQNWDINARRVRANGEVRDSHDIPVSRAPGNQVSPRITADSLGYMVTWEDWRGGIAAVYAGRLAFDGAVLDSAGIVVASDTTARSTPAIASGGECFIVWSDARFGTDQANVCGCRITLNGSIVDTNAVLVSTHVNSETKPSVAFDGVNFLAVWTDDCGTGPTPSLYAERISPEGTSLDTAPFPISHAPGGQTSARVAFGGSYYLVVWLDNRSGSQCVYAARVSRSGVVMDTGGIGVSPPALPDLPPDVASDGENFLVVWNDIYVGQDGDIRGARVSQAGTLLDPAGITICNAPHWQYEPCVAFNAQNYLVAWGDERDNHMYEAAVFATRITRQGVVLDSNGVRVRSSLAYKRPPAVASDGDDWLLVWSDKESLGICGARVSPSGQILDSSKIPLRRAPYVPPVLRWVAPNYIVVWEQSSDLYGMRVNRDGEVTDNFVLVSQPGTQSSASLASDTGGHFLAVYSGWADTFAGQYYGTNRVWGLVDPATGISDELSPPAAIGSDLKVSPNPCHGLLHIRAHSGAGLALRVVCVHDAAGRLVRRFRLDVGACRTVSLLDLPNGIYFVSIPTRTADRTSQSRFKVVLSR